MNPAGKRNRGSSSGSESPCVKQHITKVTGKMADKESSTMGATGGSDSNADIVTLLQDLKSGQESLKRTLESKIDKLRHELNASITDKIKAMKDDMHLELGILDKKFEELERKTNARLVAIEQIQNVPRPEGHDAANSQSINPLKDTERCVIAMGVHYSGESEDLGAIVQRLVDTLNSTRETIQPVAWMRLPQRDQNKPPLVKIALENREQKVNVLKMKKNLKENADFRHVWIRSSQTHAERLLHLNFKKFLSIVPEGKNYRLTGSGRVVKKTTTERGDTDAPNEESLEQH